MTLRNLIATSTSPEVDLVRSPRLQVLCWLEGNTGGEPAIGDDDDEQVEGNTVDNPIAISDDEIHEQEIQEDVNSGRDQSDSDRWQTDLQAQRKRVKR